MDRILFNEEGAVAAFRDTIVPTFDPARDIALARYRDGELMGGVVFTNFTHESIYMHVAGWHPHWVNRDMLFVAFDYPFNQLGVKRIFGEVRENNQFSIGFNERVGFRVVARIEGVYPHNIAKIVMRMDREDCRFLKVKPRHIRVRTH